MAGTRSQAASICDSIQGFNSAAVTAGLVLWKYIAPSAFRIGGIKGFAGTAGVGAGNTVLDVTVNGTSIYTTAALRPTLAALSTGEFTNAIPDGTKTLRAGDQVVLKVLSIPATTGHADLYATVALEDA